jgi:hypothetical protein
MMPLLDHFHPPLSKRRHWQNLHSAWANALRDQLNGGLLPPGFVAEVNVSLGTQVEVDLGTFEQEDEACRSGAAGGVAVWAPPAPFRTAVLDVPVQEVFEVQVLNEEEGPRLVGAVEFASPANKDRPASRHAFAIKCGSYLLQGVGLAVMDVVTSRRANLHGELLTLLAVAANQEEVASGSLYAAAYRPVPGKEATRLEYWLEKVALGANLPMLPLWIGPDLCVPLPLDQAYNQACTSSRIEL